MLGVIALSALIVPVELALLAAAALAGAVIADAGLIRKAPAIAVEMPATLSRAVPQPFSVEAGSPGPGRALRLRQPSPPDLHLDPAEGPAPLRGRVTAERRGRHALEPPGARLEGPLGLAAWYRRGAGGHEIRVYPDLPAARRLVTAVRQARFRDQGMTRRGPLGLGTEFERVREYSPDDDIRQVNWLATARMARPMSNDYRLEQDRDVVALIDCGRLMAAPAGSGTLLDAALDAATAIGAVADELGDRFGAIAFDRELRHQLPPRRGGGARAVHQLFDLEPTAADSDYTRAFQRVEGAKRAFVIVFTDLLEEIAAGPLIEAVPILSKRHAVAVATVADADLEAAVSTPPRAPIDAYRAAVAIDVLEARRRVVTRLRHAGAQVVEAPVGALGAACARAYLRAKSRALV